MRQKLRRLKNEGYLEEVELERERSDGGKPPKGYVWTNKGKRWRFESLHPNGMSPRINRRPAKSKKEVPA